MSGKIHGNHHYATGDCLNGNVNKLLMVFKWTMDYDGYMMMIIMIKDDEWWWLWRLKLMMNDDDYDGASHSIASLYTEVTG